MEVYQRLVSYKEQHDGSIKVPRKYEKDFELGQWVYDKQHIENREGGRKCFDTIGLKLQTYGNNHNGSTLVPKKYKQDSELGHWLNVQQEIKKRT